MPLSPLDDGEIRRRGHEVARRIALALADALAPEDGGARIGRWTPFVAAGMGADGTLEIAVAETKARCRKAGEFRVFALDKDLVGNWTSVEAEARETASAHAVLRGEASPPPGVTMAEILLGDEGWRIADEVCRLLSHGHSEHDGFLPARRLVPQALLRFDFDGTLEVVSARSAHARAAARRDVAMELGRQLQLDTMQNDVDPTDFLPAIVAHERRLAGSEPWRRAALETGAAQMAARGDRFWLDEVRARCRASGEGVDRVVGRTKLHPSLLLAAGGLSRAGQKEFLRRTELSIAHPDRIWRAEQSMRDLAHRRLDLEVGPEHAEVPWAEIAPTIEAAGARTGSGEDVVVLVAQGMDLPVRPTQRLWARVAEIEARGEARVLATPKDGLWHVTHEAEFNEALAGFVAGARFVVFPDDDQDGLQKFADRADAAAVAIPVPRGRTSFAAPKRGSSASET